MWTTSNSRAKALGAAILAAFACGTALPATLAAQQRIPPEAPMQALADTIERMTVPDLSRRPEPVELRSVGVRRLGRDSTLAQFAGRPFLESARDPIVIEVRTARPLGRLDGASSPEIYLNGEMIGDTWAIGPDHLVAFLPDRTALRAMNEVTVAWLGREEVTRTRRPLTFGGREVQ